MVVSRETLAGLRVALPRLKSDDAIAAALKTAGAQVDTFALTQTIPIESEQLEQMRQRLASGYYAWVVLSSWRAAQAVLAQLNTLALAPASAPTPHSPTSTPALNSAASAPKPHSPTLALSSFALASEAATRESPTKQSLGLANQADSVQQADSTQQADSIQGTTHLAVVGQSTAEWVNSHCALKPTLVGAGSAAKLLEVFPTPPTATTAAASTAATPTSATAALMSPTILATPQQPAVTMPAAPATICLPQSQLAAPTLAQGLSQLGWQVDAVATYTTVPLPQLPAHLKTQWQAGAWDAVVVTAGSSAQALLQLLGPPPEKTAVVSIGQSTTARCRELGLRVDATAATPRAEHITQAIINLFKAKDFS